MSFLFNLTFFHTVPSNSVNSEIYMLLLMQIFSFIKKTMFKLYVIHVTNDFYKFTALFMYVFTPHNKKYTIIYPPFLSTTLAYKQFCFQPTSSRHYLLGTVGVRFYRLLSSCCEWRCFRAMTTLKN